MLLQLPHSFHHFRSKYMTWAYRCFAWWGHQAESVPSRVECHGTPGTCPRRSDEHPSLCGTYPIAQQGSFHLGANPWVSRASPYSSWIQHQFAPLQDPTALEACCTSQDKSWHVSHTSCCEQWSETCVLRRLRLQDGPFLAIASSGFDPVLQQTCPEGPCLLRVLSGCRPPSRSSAKSLSSPGRLLRS